MNRTFTETWEALDKVDKSDARAYISALIGITLEAAIEYGDKSGDRNKYLETLDNIWMKLMAVSMDTKGPKPEKVTIPS